MAAAGLGNDLLLANEVLEADRLGKLDARVTVAVDSEETIRAAADAGIPEVLIDVNVGLPRCGCAPSDAGRLADMARAAGLTVRGVMGYEGHVVGEPDRQRREAGCRQAMESLVEAHGAVGGDVISAGGTGTYDCNAWASEIQAGSYVLMDTAYAKLDIPFQQGLAVLSTVISVAPDFAVSNAGLKALGMDHGNPEIDGAEVFFCSDEHTTLVPKAPVKIGDRIRIRPAHIDPTIAYHRQMHVVRGEDVIDTFEVDMRGW